MPSFRETIDVDADQQATWSVLGDLPVVLEDLRQLVEGTAT